jgi:hypothetical protein
MLAKNSSYQIKADEFRKLIIKIQELIDKIKKIFHSQITIKKLKDDELDSMMDNYITILSDFMLKLHPGKINPSTNPFITSEKGKLNN